MAINQPPITGDSVLDAWMFEVARELNSGQSRGGLSTSSVSISNTSDVENWALKSFPAEDVPNAKIASSIARDSEITVRSVDTTGPLALTIDGALSLSGTGTANLTALNVLLEITQADVDANRVEFVFNAIPSINDSHFLFMGGLKLTEILDYNIIRNAQNFIQLTTPVVQEMVGLRFELSNWSA